MASVNMCRFVVAVCLFFQGGLVQAAELRVSAAASLTEVIRELSHRFAEAHEDLQILTNFGSSGSLAKQISLGGPADVYISANPKWMDFLAKQGKVDSNSRKTLASNSLVFVGRPKNNLASLADLVTLERIVIGSPKSVPAGQYAREAMEAAGIYERLRRAGSLVMAKDVRQALMYADRGEADGAFVYRSDARLAKEAVILLEVSQELYSPVTCPMALTRTGRDSSLAKRFYHFLLSPEAASVLQGYGFMPVVKPAE